MQEQEHAQERESSPEQQLLLGQELSLQGLARAQVPPQQQLQRFLLTQPWTTISSFRAAHVHLGSAPQVPGSQMPQEQRRACQAWHLPSPLQELKHLKWQLMHH